MFGMHQKIEFSVQVWLPFLRNSDKRAWYYLVLKDSLESLNSVSSLPWGNRSSAGAQLLPEGKQSGVVIRDTNL